MGPIDSVKIQLSVVLGKSMMPINQLLRMGRGAVIELDTDLDDEVEIRANNLPFARGEVTIVNNKIAVTVREKLKSAERRNSEPLIEQSQSEPSSA